MIAENSPFIVKGEFLRVYDSFCFVNTTGKAKENEK